MPFGEGPQSCVGMKFVLMEVKLALIAILGKYKFVKALETEVMHQQLAHICLYYIGDV